MNFADFGRINALKYPDEEFFIELTPSKDLRRSLTWKEFNEQTNRVANFLREKFGVQKGDTVLHLQMNSIEWYVTYFGVLKTGAAVVPLNYRFASQDIEFAANATEPKAFILSDGFLPKVQPAQENMPSIKNYICIGETVPDDMVAYEEVMKASPEDYVADVDDDDMAELMFTSGTTGKPKPVCQAHKTLFQIGVAVGLTYNDGYETTYLAAHPFYHSGSMFLSFPSYMAGGKIVCLLELSKPNYLLDAISQEKVTSGWVTVPTMSDTVEAVKRGDIDLSKYDFSHTRYIVIGAQPVPHSLFEDIKRLFPFKTGNIYGITEGGGGGSFNLYDEDVLRKPGSIGKPTFGVEAKVVDFEGKEVPVGEVGELIFKAPRLMKEYYKNPEKTAETIKDGWLYTGDLVRKDEEGYYYIADRKKDLIIRGGENIFPAEIEDFLHKNPKIADVAVIGYPHERLVEIAMAIIQLKPGETMTEQEVIDFCKEGGLAKYKWPEKIVFAEVPRNPSGKIEKPKLREMYIGKKTTIPAS